MEWIEHPILMLEVRGSNNSHSISKIPLLHPKPSGSLELGVWSLSCLGGDPGSDKKMFINGGGIRDDVLLVI